MKKPAGQAVDPRNGTRYELKAAPTSKPQLPEKIRNSVLPESVQAFDRYVSSPLANVLTHADLVVLERWVLAIDQHARATEIANREPMVLGSMGQSILNPMYKVASEAYGAIRDCERQLGIGPKNRADLGITLIAQQKSLQDTHASMPKPAAPEEDPRVIMG